MTLRYTLLRLAQAAVTLWGISTIIFLAVRVAGDPVVLLVPPDTTREQIDELRTAFGLNDPLPLQYGRFLADLARFHFGDSFRFNQPAMEVVLQFLPSTLKLTVAAMLIAVGVALPLGLVAATHRGSPVDQLAMVAALLGQSSPTFWVGIMLILLFSVQLRLLPSIGDQGPSSLVLPAVTLGLFSTAKLSRLVRSGVLEVISRDYVRTARAKGLAGRVVLLRHVLPNALISVVTVAGLETAVLLGGAVITETVFAWPGMGRLAIQAITTRDYPLVQAVVFTFAAMLVATNFLVDLLYPLLDPRVKLE